MIEIVIIIYSAINLFMAGYWFNENNKWESRFETIVFSLLVLLFGVLGYLIFWIAVLVTPCLRWCYREIQFNYRFYFTDYWDKILLNDDYSTILRTKEEKLNRLNELMSKVSRHAKQIKRKYSSRL